MACLPTICPYCQSRQISKRKGTTDLGYRIFRCHACRHKFKERTGTPFNHLEFPTAIVFQVVLCRLRYQLSLRDLAELFLLRGFPFTHEAVREWEERFAPLLTEQLRRKRQGKTGKRWYVDETYLKVKGKGCYLYRAIDKAGNLVDSLLSATRDMAAAQQFFRKALSVAEEAPPQVTTDGHDSYPRAVREVLGCDVEHRDNAYLNRRIEQDHRGSKQRYYPTLGCWGLPLRTKILFGIRRSPTILSSPSPAQTVCLPRSSKAVVYNQSSITPGLFPRQLMH